MHTENIVSLTKNAMQQVVGLVNEEKEEDDSIEEMLLKINIKGGGCSGFQYQFSLVETTQANDSIFKNLNDGSVSEVNIVIDQFSMLYLQGAIVDFKEDAMGARFIINNPNATTTCSCGDSFSVD